MFHHMNILNARKVQHSRVINKNILHKKCKNNPNCQKVGQMAILSPFERPYISITKLTFLTPPSILESLRIDTDKNKNA